MSGLFKNILGSTHRNVIFVHTEKSKYFTGEMVGYSHS